MYKMNSSRTNPKYFEFTLFVDIANLRYLFFALCLFIYMTIISANMIIILTIFLEKCLHQPIYIFVCLLSVNSLYGSAGFFPRLLFDLWMDTHFILRPACFLQIYVIYTYAYCEISILSVMAYDRLVAICQPLHYHRKMTIKKSFCLWATAVLHPALSVACVVSLTAQLTLCGNKLERIFCVNRAIFDLSCTEATHIDVIAPLLVILSTFSPFFFVLYSYARILTVCRRGPTEARGKALKTCVPHLITFTTYSCSLFIEAAISKYNNEINPIVTAVLSMEYLVVPSLMNPLIYGLKMPQIKAAIVRRFMINTNMVPKATLETQTGFYE